MRFDRPAPSIFVPIACRWTACKWTVCLAIAISPVRPASAQQTVTAETESVRQASSDSDQGFEPIFDGTLNGWKVSQENSDSWKVVDGSLQCGGPRAHLYYDGPIQPLENFHFVGEVKTSPGANSGIYFHTRYQPTGWPKYGYECQVNVSQSDPKKTSSLYAVENISAEQLAAAGVKDNHWYTQEIIVRDRRIILKVNGRVMVDYTEPENKAAFDENFERRLGRGTFALQAHDPDSVVSFRNLKVKPLD